MPGVETGTSPVEEVLHDAGREGRRAAAAPDPVDLALPRPPGGIRRWLDAHPRAVDVTLAAVGALAPAVVLVVLSTDFPLWQVALSLLICFASAGSLLLRRRLPVSVAVFTGMVALLPVPFNSSGGFTVLLALYSMGRYANSRRVWIGYGAISVVTAAVLALSGIVLNDPDGFFGLSNIVLYLVPVLIGISVAGRRRYVDAILARAADLARERDQLAELAVAAERARIARELHDVVSHSLTVMVTLSEGAAAQAEAGTDAAPEAMRRVAATGRQSLAEMRRLLGVLRSPEQDAELAPQPTDEDVDALIDRFRAAGLPVRLTIAGPPVRGAAIRLAVFRILQEGLTNALRHAHGARRVDAAIRHEGRDIVIEVVDDAPRASSARPGSRPNGDVTRAAGARDAAEARYGAGGTNDEEPAVRQGVGPGIPETSATDVRHPAAEAALPAADRPVPRLAGAGAVGSGPRNAAQPRSGAGGHGSGLIGIRERAALHGGTAHAGPLPGGGWRMRAELFEDEADRPAAPGRPAGDGSEDTDRARGRLGLRRREGPTAADTGSPASGSAAETPPVVDRRGSMQDGAVGAASDDETEGSRPRRSRSGEEDA